MWTSRVIALIVSIACAACATTYEGGRNQAALGSVAFGAGMSTWLAGTVADDASLGVSGVAVATAGMALIAVGAVNMVRLPRRVVVALKLTRDLIEEAKLDHCDVVRANMHLVLDLDFVVYEVVLVQDPDVATCLQESS